MKLAVSFCIHSGELEIEALLLAASLRKHWPSTLRRDPQWTAGHVQGKEEA